MTAPNEVWVEDHEPLDSPDALFRHLSEDHDIAEARDLDPDSAPVRFWLRRHDDLHTSDHAAPATPTSRRAAAAPSPAEPDHDASHEDVRTMAPPASPPATATPQGRAGRRVMQPAPQTIATGKPTRTPRGVRAGWQWLVRLIRGYLLAATLLLGAVIAFTPATVGLQAGYRLDVTNATLSEGGLVDAAGVLALRAAGWVTGQAADRQAELLTDHPLATRLLTPAAVSLHGWIQPHRLPIAIAGTILLAALIFLGVDGLPGRRATDDSGGRVRLQRRWWLLGVALTLLTTAVVCFPAPALTAANAPGLLVARQSVNFTANHLLPPDSLDAAHARDIQARLAEDYWTQFVTNPVSRQQTRSSILVHTPSEHRGEVTAFLHARGVQPATGLHGAVISTSGLGSAAAGALVIGGAAWLALAAQAALLMLLLGGVWLVPVWAARGRVQRLILWWLLPLGVLTLLVAAGALVSVAATRGAAWVAWAWELLSSAVTGAVVATGLGVLVVWRVRRRIRRYRARRDQQRGQAAEPTGDDARRVVGKAGAAA